MEENIPLESSKKKNFETTIAGIKKLIKTGKFVVPDKTAKPAKKKPTAFASRGVVYIGHIPHGFYEDQMQGYFKQFGKVTNVRVARSAKNGRSKGYGFVEFADRDVAVIVAETMNNYLMDKRLLKAEVIPADREMPGLFKGKSWEEQKNCPGIKNRKKTVNAFNKDVTHEHWIGECKKQLNRLFETKTKLKALGIDFEFIPSDIPEELAGYKPKPNKTKKKKNQRKTLNDNDKSDDDETTLKASKSPKKKEKSLNKPQSPVAKAPKPKKLKKKQNISVEKVPKVVPKKQKINKSKDVELEGFNVTESKVPKMKSFGGIQKKKTGKDKAPISRRDFSDEKNKTQFKDLLSSNLVKIAKRDSKKSKK